MMYITDEGIKLAFLTMLNKLQFASDEVLKPFYLAIRSLSGKERSKRIKELDNMTQEELAKKCGVSRQTVNAIENNKYDPTLSLAFSLARELKITVDQLFIHE